jgi:hypothetical protein
MTNTTLPASEDLNRTQLANVHRFFTRLLPIPREVFEYTVRNAFGFKMWNAEGANGFFIEKLVRFDGEPLDAKHKIEFVHQISEWVELAQGQFDDFEGDKAASNTQTKFDDEIDDDLQEVLNNTFLQARENRASESNTESTPLGFIHHWLHREKQSYPSITGYFEDGGEAEHRAYLAALKYYLVEIPRDRLQDVLAIKHNTGKHNRIYLKNIHHLCRIAVFGGTAEIPKEFLITLKHIGIRLEIKYPDLVPKDPARHYDEWQHEDDFEKLVSQVERAPSEHIVRYVVDFLHHCTRRRPARPVSWLKNEGVTPYYERISAAVRTSNLSMRVKDYVECFSTINTKSTADQIDFLTEFSKRATDPYMQGYSLYILGSLLERYSKERFYALFDALQAFHQIDKTRAEAAFGLIWSGNVNSFDNDERTVVVDNTPPDSLQLRHSLSHFLSYCKEFPRKGTEVKKLLLDRLFSQFRERVKQSRGRCMSCAAVHRATNAGVFVTTPESLNDIQETIETIATVEPWVETPGILGSWKELIHLVVVSFHGKSWEDWSGGEFSLEDASITNAEHENPFELVRTYLSDYDENTLFADVVNFFRHVSEPHIKPRDRGQIRVRAREEIAKKIESSPSSVITKMLKLNQSYLTKESPMEEFSIDGYEAYLSKYIQDFFMKVEEGGESAWEDFLTFLSALSSNQAFGEQNLDGLTSMNFLIKSEEFVEEIFNNSTFTDGIRMLLEELAIIIIWAMSRSKIRPDQEFKKRLENIRTLVEDMRE